MNAAGVTCSFPSRCSPSRSSLIVWRGPDWRLVHDAFTAVTWEWVAAAIGLNLLSVLARAFAWDTAIKQSIAPPHPRFPLVFSAFSVGLFANAVLPGRVGELARVAVLRRRLSAGANGHHGDAGRVGLRPPHVRPLPRVDARHLGPAHREDPALGADLDRHRPRDRAAALPDRRRARAAPAARAPTSSARVRAADPFAPGRDSRSCARRRAAATAAVVPVRRLDLPALRGVGDDGGVQHPPAALGRRPRARADERRDDLPALARQLRARADRGRAPARPLRRRVRARRRVRHRAAGDRGVGRRRRRAHLPRARRAVVRDAARHGRRRPRRMPTRTTLEQEPERARARVAG